MSNFMQIRPLGAELFRANRHDEADFTFLNFANGPKETVHDDSFNLLAPEFFF